MPQFTWSELFVIFFAITCAFMVTIAWMSANYNRKLVEQRKEFEGKLYDSEGRIRRLEGQVEVLQRFLKENVNPEVIIDLAKTNAAHPPVSTH